MRQTSGPPSSCEHPASMPHPSTLSPWHAPALQLFLALRPHPQTKWLYLVSLGRQSLSGALLREDTLTERKPAGGMREQI